MNTSLSKRIQYTRTDSGIDLCMLRTSTKDVVICKMAFRGGKHGTYNKQALAFLASDMLPGGTKKQKRDVVLEKFEMMGASISVEFLSDHIVVALASRSKVFVDAFRLLVEVLSTPSFSESEYKIAFSRVKNTITTASEDAGTRSAIALRQGLYKKGHPHWEPALSDISLQLKKTSRNEVKDFYQNSFSSVGAQVCIVGDIAPKKLQSEIVRILKMVPSKRPKETGMLHVDYVSAPKNVDTVVTLHDKYNVDTLLGIPLLITRDSSEFKAFSFGVSILGASSTSRLFTVLRTKESLTYGAYATIEGTVAGYPGLIKCRTILPSTVFKKGRDVLRRTVKEFTEKGVTPKEVRERKIELLGKYKVGMSTTVGICEIIFNTMLNEKPLSELDIYEDVIQSLTPKQVNNAIHTYIDYSKAITAAAGALRADGTTK